MVYLDYNASTPVDPRVLTAVLDANEEFGNPASSHSRGQAAGEVIEEARRRVGHLFGRSAQDVILTSGASEGALLGLVGAMLAAEGRPNVVVGATEHKAVLAAAEFGAKLTGGQVRVAEVDRCGVLDVDHLTSLLDKSVSVVSVMAANNETGVMAPLAEVSSAALRADVLRFVDVTQLAGKSDTSEVGKQADLMVCSSHKIYGPKGAGALIASRHVQRRMAAMLSGGGQERGFRGGTPNTPGIVGFGLAAEIAEKEQATDAGRVGQLATRLLDSLSRRIPDAVLNSADAERISNTVNVRFVGADAEAVMLVMPKLMVSAGSACQSAVPSQSHVLLAMGMRDSEAAESLRISLGRPTTDAEIDQALEEIELAVGTVRRLTSS